MTANAQIPPPTPSRSATGQPVQHRRTGQRPQRRRRPPSFRRIWLVTCVVLLCSYALLVPWLAGIDPVQVDYASASEPPSTSHWFGTDAAGRDLFVRVAEGLRVSLTVAAASTTLAAAGGTVAGLVASICGGRVDQGLMRIVDGFNAVPHLLAAIVLMSFFPGSMSALILTVGITHWTSIARLVRTEILTLRERDHIRAAVNAGYTRTQLAKLHLLPAILPQVAVSSALLLPHAVWHEATLSFLGLGMPPHAASLGNLLNMAQVALIDGTWWALVFPAGALIITTLVASAVLAQRDEGIRTP